MPAAADLSAYLTARAADAGGDPARAASAYARALAAAPDDAGVALRAYAQALIVGDDALATRAAAVLTKANAAPPDAALIPLGRAARADDPAAVERALATLGAGPLAILGPALSAWTSFARDGNIPDAPATGLNPAARRLLAETRPLLLIAGGQPDDGLAAIMALGGAGRPPLDLRIAAAQLLFGQGRDAAARTLLAGDDPVLARLRTGAPASPTLAFGVSRLLARVAAELGREESVPLGIALARASLRADPAYDRARLLLADKLAQDGATDLALAMIDVVPPTSAFAPAAASARVTVLADAGRTQAALALARIQADGPSPAAWERYAGLLSGAGNHREAAIWYRRLTDGPDAKAWGSWLNLGNALDEAGRWPEAKAALTRAVALAPDEPLVLNNLGYAQARHGERRDAIRLLERAAALAPDDASIADSLGWAYHLTGDAPRALPLIERAAAAQPASAEIADHLGDIYWTLGRRYEARYAWNAARVAGGGVEIAAKLDRGLPIRR